MEYVDVDIAKLVRAALEQQGCNPDLLDNFDGHSTITLDFKDSPSILVSRDEKDEEIWVWARIENVYESAYLQSLEKLSLLQQQQTCDFTPSRQVQFYFHENILEIKAHIRRGYLEDAEKFSQVLDGFFHILKEFNEAIK
ncbi:SPI-1 type III secretion system chaperone SpaK [Candidatus Regiella insecticola]|uniref:Type III secretion system chaperone SpaK n=1 Tax=Candidatus Regiella insecticola TaxID=138073 RepID=A0A6L2ZQL5_9ENTR|nr:SPI-1 type III secretion system chaperone SpaK [Candidatus Regiella insecticola]GFN47066.1 type III secretion system chaperone SpaK [Candidatus Regiella insecticola]